MLELKTARKLAKNNNRKIKTYTVDFTDLARCYKRFFKFVPNFNESFTSELEYENYKNSLNAEELQLFLTEKLTDNSDIILKGR